MQRLLTQQKLTNQHVVATSAVTHRDRWVFCKVLTTAKDLSDSRAPKIRPEATLDDGEVVLRGRAVKAIQLIWVPPQKLLQLFAALGEAPAQQWVVDEPRGHHISVLAVAMAVVLMVVLAALLPKSPQPSKVGCTRTSNGHPCRRWTQLPRLRCPLLAPLCCCRVFRLSFFQSLSCTLRAEWPALFTRMASLAGLAIRASVAATKDLFAFASTNWAAGGAAQQAPAIASAARLRGRHRCRHTWHMATGRCLNISGKACQEEASRGTLSMR